MSWQAKVYGRWGGGSKWRNRRRPRKAECAQILFDQNNRCCYCGTEFGTITTNRSGKALIARCQWDHFVPYSHEPMQQREGNWMAACNICNGIKSNHVFDSLIAAQDYVLSRRWSRAA